MTVQMPDFSSDPNAVPQSDPFGNILKGYKLSQLPAQMRAQRTQQQQALDMGAANLQGKQLQNQYYVPLIQSQLAQRQAATGLIDQQSNWYGKLTQSEIAKNQAEVAKAGQTDNGITIGTDENGKPIIQIGGSGGGSSRYGGRLGTDENGNITSELTNSNKTAIQTRAIGEDVIKPFLDQIITNVPQFQTPEKKAQLFGSSLLNKFGLADWQDKNLYAQAMGLNSNLPSQKATGDSAIINSSEGLIKAMGLKANDQQVAMIQKALAPQPGESENGYRNRTTTFIKNLSQNTNTGKKLLATGINTGINQNSPYGNVTSAPQPQAQPQEVPQQNTNPYGASQLPETWVPVQQPVPMPQQAQQQTLVPNPSVVKHLTDNYTLEQLKQMREQAQ